MGSDRMILESAIRAKVSSILLPPRNQIVSDIYHLKRSSKFHVERRRTSSWLSESSSSVKGKIAVPIFRLQVYLFAQVEYEGLSIVERSLS